MLALVVDRYKNNARHLYSSSKRSDAERASGAFLRFIPIPANFFSSPPGSMKLRENEGAVSCELRIGEMSTLWGLGSGSGNARSVQ